MPNCHKVISASLIYETVFMTIENYRKHSGFCISGVQSKKCIGESIDAFNLFLISVLGQVSNFLF